MIKSIFPKFGFSALPFVKKPLVLMFNITERCNLHCSYCFGRYYSGKKELSLLQISKILSEFYQLGARRLGLSGGEPLLHKDIDKVIKVAVDLGYDVGINSNGILVPQHLPALRLVKNLSISLDAASEKTNARYRGRGSFKKAIQGVKAAAEAGIPLHLCCTLTDANLNEWQAVVELGKKYRAMVQLSPLYPQFEKEGEFRFSKQLEKKIKKTITKIIQEKRKRGNNIFFSESTYRLMLNWPDYKKDTSSQREAGHPICLAGKKMVSLDSRGNLFPCLRVSHSVPGQNCLKVGVKQAYQDISQSPCKSCRWACFIEYNSLFNFKLPVVLNLLSGRLRKRHFKNEKY